MTAGGNVSSGRWCRIGGVFSLALAGIFAVLPGTAEAATITSPAGPLTSVDIGKDLICQATYLGDKHPEWDTSSQCGTFLALGGTTYKPAGAGQVKGTNFTKSSQPQSFSCLGPGY